MAWWKLKLDVSQAQRFTSVLHGLSDALHESDINEFLTALAAEDGPICAFFRQMFETRGDGGTWYGQGWKSLEPNYLAEKRKKFGEDRIGFRTTELYKSLTSDSPFAIRRVVNGTLTFGSAVQDTDSKRHQSYAGFFNRERPVIDQQMLSDLTAYLTEGEGKPAFDALVAQLKARLLERTR